MTDCQGRLWLEISVYAQHKGSLDGFGDSWISFLGNQVFAWTSMWGCKVGNIFAKIYSFMTNGSDPLKIWVSFHLLTFAHLGWCLWCEGEGLSHCDMGTKLGWAKWNGHSGQGDVDKNSMPATRPEIWPKLLFRGSWIEVPKKYYNYLAEVKKSEI